jgi:hypothetical protein
MWFEDILDAAAARVVDIGVVGLVERFGVR